MNKLFTIIIAVFLYHHCLAQPVIFPAAEKKPVTDDFFNKYKVVDDYRWMENAGDPLLKKWVDSENEMANKFVAKASSRNNALQSIDRLANVDYKNPTKKGKYYFTYSYYDNTGVPALFISNSIKDDEPRVIVDPNFISGKGIVTIKDYEVSEDSKYLAYEYSRDGSDWADIKITAIGGAPLKDHLTRVKFSDIAWHKNGFYYSTYPAVNAMGRTEGQMVYYHQLETDQAKDELIFKRNDPSIQFEFITTADGRYFVLEEKNNKAGICNYFYMDYKDEEPSLKPLVLNLKFSIDILGSHDGKFIAKNFHNADNGSIVEIDPQNPTQWKVISTPYSEALLMNVQLMKDKILAIYQSKLRPSLIAMDYKGNVLHSVTFPLGTSIGGLHGNPQDKEVLFNYQSYTTPPIVYLFNINDYTRTLPHLSTVGFDYDAYEYKEVAYTVNDSVKVPMMLIYKKGIKLNGGANPTLLETYGGFGATTKPSFDPGIVYFLNKGGIYAYAYVRGGGDLGAKWVKGGIGKNKQNSFSDFIAGAEFLIKQGYTSPAKLAITGGSNGGLVVAAAAIQRPDLFKAVIPVVAPFDMIRFANFTVGAFHEREYGTVKDSTSFTRLYNYSPYNNIKSNVNYPAMLIITSDNDDRVPPLHSFKFAARMQSRAVQTNPIYLMTRKQSGHYGAGGNSFVSHLAETANLYGYVVEMLK